MYSNYSLFITIGKVKGKIMEILFLLLGIIVMDIAALRWGNDSRDGIDSPEWLRSLQRHF
ncbi:hypothetical protein KDAU_61400 [Dictyobacter aurantiacus]|uniref:Uncharacterized protein n=1 Tax=Dictyobacter aurantiacus TaxID=1936993 RepID=A0A401ZPM5_9CHLR|nr:hypothetical protein KDAU_61400 [Dictyobacter aurantiacus]